MENSEVKVDPSLSKELVVGNKIFRSACDFRVTERDLKKAQKELKETEEKRRTCLEELKTILSKDKRMTYRTDDDYLIRFLRIGKYDVPKTYKVIKKFYTMRNEDPLLFTLPPDVECKLKGKIVSMMPYTNDNGEIVYIHRLGYWNPSENSVRDLCTMITYVSDVVSMNPHAQIDGVIEICDFKGINARQLSEFLCLSALKMLSKFLQEMYPYRIKKVIALNVGAVLYANLSIVRFFMKKKVADRLVIIGSDLEELHKHVNPEILPKEYGGKLDDEESCFYLKKVVFSNKEYFRYENSFIGYKE